MACKTRHSKEIMLAERVADGGNLNSATVTFDVGIPSCKLRVEIEVYFKANTRGGAHAYTSESWQLARLIGADDAEESQPVFTASRALPDAWELRTIHRRFRGSAALALGTADALNGQYLVRVTWEDDTGLMTADAFEALKAEMVLRSNTSPPPLINA